MNEFNQVFFPASITELFSIWNRYPEASIFSSGANLLQNQKTKKFKLPNIILSLDHIEDLHKIDRTERYLEIGAMVTLNQVINIGKIVPAVLKETLQFAANLNLRNLIRLGSAICQSTDEKILSAAMIALDARYELRTAGQSRWIPAALLARNRKDNVFKKQELLCRIRVPLDQWDYTICRQFKSPVGIIGAKNESGFCSIMVAMQKDILSSVRITFAGRQITNEKNLEYKLVGKQLPLDISEAESFVQVWKNYLESIEGRSEFACNRFLNFIESAIMHFVD
ncbi:MAG: hypothetical protein Ta2B_19310 [Termitinemataceae bacterium]|nr:MAG: hypothetical protein Ta2B_19310 [Termitinemataceae bacterium]